MSQLKQAITTRAAALTVARPIYQIVISQKMLEKQQQLQILNPHFPSKALISLS